MSEEAIKRRCELKKIGLKALALAVVLAVLLPATVAVAQPQLSSDVAPELRAALAIRSPRVAGVGQLVTITVFDRHSGVPVPRAGVWAVSVRGYGVEADVASSEEYSQFLGWTNDDGKVFHRFRDQGYRVLAAVKDGFVPGFAQIVIKPLRALAIKAPGIARVGQLVTVTVVERYLGIPVHRAGVWAINVDDIKAESNDPELYASLVEEYGQFLGWTNDDGRVFHRFREPGRYVLVAIKDELVPGFARIRIVSLQPAEAQPLAAPKQTADPR